MLEVDQLSQIYSGNTQALDCVTLSIPQGVFGLLGPNGAGKSTLMRCIATLQTPSSGSIRYNDIDVLKEPERLRRTLGYLPQDFGVYPRISAMALLDHIAVLKGITGRGERRETVEILLQQVNLWAARKKPVAKFSGGMRQRFGVAQALIGRPSLIIVDEPTAGLDPEERNRFLNLISEIGEQGVVLLSTHIVEDVADLCPRMAVLDQGKIRLQGAPQALIHALKGRVWRKYVAREDLPAYLIAYKVISSRRVAGQVMIHIEADDDPGEGFEPVPGGLADVYFRALNRRDGDAARAA